MKKTTFRCFFFFLCLIFGGWSQQLHTTSLDEVYITNSRFELSKEFVGKVIDKISSTDLIRRQGWTLAQLLNRLVGVNIQGSFGQSGSVL